MPAVEMAHIRSIGMGGKNIASDRIGNVMAACQRHARHSDLLPGDGETLNEMRASIEKVIDVPATAANVAWELVEALTKAVAAGRSAFQLDEGDDDDV